jgi:hypothetical protein
MRARSSPLGIEIKKVIFSRSGSHGFISSIMDDTFWSGLAIFIVSNYTVIVWIIVDLILILGPRNVSQMAEILNKVPKNDQTLEG